MGFIMREHDIHIGTFLDLFNMRFAPSQGTADTLYGGINEIVALQKEFEIFRPGRAFVECARLLGLGGAVNHAAKSRWMIYLAGFPNYQSNVPGENGDQRIVNALIANLAASSPLPCYMLSHDARPAGQGRVIVEESSQPLFYLEQKYLTISLPMRPRPRPRARGAAR